MPVLEDLRAALAGRYAIERELGRGGMAQVFLARDVKHQRAVAVKVLRPELAGALGPDRFLREIAIAARLAHPHVLPLFDSGEAAGLLYYITPYIEGESLRDRLTRESQLALEDALAITAQVAAALSYAHSRDVVHRDIKPENILLQGDEVLVADFGIARAITEAGGASLTETGIAVGTPAYMSPEQALAERTPDGRSDVYSLGCVLYEMLAGHPPYTGATAQAILARRLTDPVPPLRTLRASVPESVERAIGRALARVPADRFGTAAAFAAALGVERAASVPPGRSRVRWWSAAAAVVVLGAAVALVRSGSRADVLPDPNLLAVAPFDARGASLNDWGEGVMEYLSRSLDAAGSLRTVSPSVFLRNWEGRADAASARVLGRRTGAGLVVFGSLVQGARDSVRLRATLLDLNSGAQADLEVSGDTAGMDRVVDSLAVRVLVELGRARPVGAVRNAPFGATSLPAIKAFLQGERLYRRGEYDAAFVYHSRAAALDTTFALAHRRMGLDLSWLSSSPAAGGTSTEAQAFRAAGLNRGLAPRDSLLIVADSLFYARYADGQPSSTLLVFGERLFATLAEATRRFPLDPEVWQAVGEARYHHDAFAPPLETLQAFDRAIALDSGFVPAYEHVLQLALASGDVQRARRYAAAYLAQRRRETVDNRTDPVMMELAAVLLTAPASTTGEIASLIDTIGVTPLWRAGLEHLGWWMDSAETAIQLFRALPLGRRSLAWAPDWVADTLMWPQYLAGSLAARGRLSDAYDVYRSVLSGNRQSSWAWFANPFRDLALLQAAPADSVDAVIARSAGAPTTPRWLAWWLDRRDAAALARVAERAAALERSAGDSVDRLLARALGSAAAGYLALLRGDSLAAIGHLDALPDSLCRFVDCGYELEKLKLAELLAARGDNVRAAAILDRWMWTFRRVQRTMARLARARLAERLGDPELAARYYAFVIDAWQHGDPAVQSYVTEAREGLRRLGAEPRR